MNGKIQIPNNTKQKKVEMTILISHKTDAREKKITGDKEEHNNKSVNSPKKT